MNQQYFGREREEERVHVFSGPVYLPLQLRNLRSRICHHEDDESLQTLVYGAIVPSLDYAHALLLDSIIPLLSEPAWLHLRDTLCHYVSTFFVEARGQLVALVEGPNTSNLFHSALRTV